jgi:NAD(P)-dependent dehydrogenase (short-subunit alcohol dehydrogenase family)
MAEARAVFETNTFGVIAMTQAVIPQFRARRAGLVVNVTSSATLAPMPLVAVYTASKAAIEAFTESLAFELSEFGVGVKLVEPGYCETTAFTANSGPRIANLIPETYAPFAQRVFARLGEGFDAVLDVRVREIQEADFAIENSRDLFRVFHARGRDFFRRKRAERLRHFAARQKQQNQPDAESAVRGDCADAPDLVVRVG